MEYDPDEEEMDDVNLDDKRERHWRMVFEENYGGVDYAKELLHSKRWDVYVMLQFTKEVGVDIKEEQAGVEYDPDEEEMDDVNLDDKRERH